MNHQLRVCISWALAAALVFRVVYLLTLFELLGWKPSDSVLFVAYCLLLAPKSYLLRAGMRFPPSDGVSFQISLAAMHFHSFQQ